MSSNKSTNPWQPNLVYIYTCTRTQPCSSLSTIHCSTIHLPHFQQWLDDLPAGLLGICSRVYKRTRTGWAPRSTDREASLQSCWGKTGKVKCWLSHQAFDREAYNAKSSLSSYIWRIGLGQKYKMRSKGRWFSRLRYQLSELNSMLGLVLYPMWSRI